MKNILIYSLSLLLICCSINDVYASNGNDIIGSDPVSISLGGTGIAVPQNSISAVLLNPATICFNLDCTDFDVAVTAGNPKAEATIRIGNTTIKANSDDKVFPVPSVGLSIPLNNTFPRWSVGIAAGGVSGLGIDYENSEIDQPEFFDFGSFGKFPLIIGEFAELNVIKVAPSVAFQPVENFSAGLSFHVNYGNLDLGSNTSTDYALGVQPGLVYKFNEYLVLGATYISGQEFTYKSVSDIDGDGSEDDLELEKPQEIGFGVGFIPLKDTLIFEIDLKWKNWADAKGYEDLDWDNQWIVALGAQYKITKKLILRTGYNYGSNPVEEHNGFVGSSMIEIQGKTLPVYYYETLRIFGNPAVEKHHASLGIGYELTDRIAFHSNYTHIFDADITERGTDLMGRPMSLESKVHGKAFGVNFTFRF